MNETDQREDLWGYGRRLSFVRGAIADAYPKKHIDQISILDIGCGTGSSLGLPLAEVGFRYTGLDTHAPSIAEADRLASHLPNAGFRCGPLQQLQAGPFDVIILSEVLEHVDDPAELLKASLEKLAKDGLVIVTVPNGFGEFEWDSWIYKGLGFEKLVAARGSREPHAPAAVGSTLNIENGHVQFFTMRRLAAMFANAGLEIIDKRGSSLVSGPFIAHTLGRFQGFVELNAKAADHLPMMLASGWFFSLRRKEQKQQV